MERAALRVSESSFVRCVCACATGGRDVDRVPRGAPRTGWPVNSNDGALPAAERGLGAWDVNGEDRATGLRRLFGGGDPFFHPAACIGWGRSGRTGGRLAGREVDGRVLPATPAPRAADPWEKWGVRA